jgi:hypothetical protein
VATASSDGGCASSAAGVATMCVGGAVGGRTGDAVDGATKERQASTRNAFRSLGKAADSLDVQSPLGDFVPPAGRWVPRG